MDKLVLVMAAGESKRMRSDIPKALHRICGKPILWYVLDTVGKVCDTVIPILGHGRERIAREVGIREYAMQDFSTGKGTGHAVMCASHYLEGKTGQVIVTAGDMPLISEESYSALREAVASGASAALLYAELDNPFNYGRVIMDEDGRVQCIVEEKDCTEEQKRIRESNASVYCFDIDALKWALPRIHNHNAANEYYLTDCVEILAEAGYDVAAVPMRDASEFKGINTRAQLDEAARVMRHRINTAHMLAGVTMVDSLNTYIDIGVTIGRDTIIYPGVVIEGDTVIGENCVILPACHLVNANISDNSTCR